MIDTSLPPYFDDFNEEKSFHKILFKPSLAVQSRELNQLQSILQKQIDRFGKHVFVNGATVLGSERFFENNLDSIRVTSQVNRASIIGKTIIGNTSGTQALVKEYDVTNQVLVTKITSGNKFLSTETIHYVDDSNTTITIALNPTNTFSSAMLFSVNSGVIFVNENFVYQAKQSIILDSTSNTGSVSIGFDVNEDVITSDDDESLLDGASGSPNFAAPGADRYFIDLVLTANSTKENAIEIAKVVDGQLVYVQQRTLYAELEKEFARRTYDESGSYTVRPFYLGFQDHVTDASARPIINAGSIIGYNIVNGGVKFTTVPTVTVVGNGTGATATAVLDNNSNSATYQQIISIDVNNTGSGYTEAETYVKISGDTNKFSVKLEPGKAYVKGFEFETTSPTYLTVDKARTTESADNLDISVVYGNFVNVNTLFGNLNTTTFTDVELHNVVRGSVSGATSKVGTAKLRFLKYVSGTVGNAAAIYKLYLYNIVIDSGKLFKDTESVVVRSGSTVLAGGNIDLLSKVGGVTGGDVFLSGADSTSLIFPLNHAYTKTLRDTLGASQNDYTFERTFTSVSFSAGTGSITTASGLERFVGGSGTYASTINDQNYHVVVTAVGTSAYTVGQVIKPTSISGGTISPSTPHTTTINFGAVGDFTATVIAGVNGNNQIERTKTLSAWTIKIIATPNGVQGAHDSLEKSDIFGDYKVYNTGTTNPTAVTINGSTGALTWGAVAHTDVTANYILDDGQRDDFYDHGSLVLNGTAPSNTHYLLVAYRNFAHAGTGYFSVNSYAIPYDSIPSYTSGVSGLTYRLSDVIDFRPRRVDGSTTISGAQVPNPDVSFNADYQYYVGRIDKVIANSNKTFSIKQGNPATVPQVPSDEPDGINLYVLEIPPYTFDLNQISVKYVENKRYTMRDIGKLERRIENLEYYTQLSLLEKQAQDEQITDASNLEKFKNGFFVDSFNSNESLFNTDNGTAWAKQIWGWWNNRESGVNTWNKGASRVYSSSASDSLNIDYHVAIDPLSSTLRAEAIPDYAEYNYIESPTTKTGDLVTLDYTEVNYIDQNLGSKSVNINPFDVIAFNGDIELNPASDLWVETLQLPAVNRISDVQLPDAPTVNKVTKTATYSKGLLFHVTSKTSTTVTNVLSSSTSSLGNSIVDIQFIPFIRARTILGLGEKFKPKARLYPFVENTPVSQYCRPLTLLETTTHTGDLFQIDEVITFRTGTISGPVVGTAKVAFYSPPKLSDNTKRQLTVYDVTGTIPVSCIAIGTHTNNAIVSTIATYALGSALVPDEFGVIGFEFQMPANTFRTGDRLVRLVDNIDNNPATSQSVGQTTYTARGEIRSQQETLLTTRLLQDQTTNVTTGYAYDPLAQSFFVDPRFNPAGIQLSSVDVFFRTKSDSIPVTLEIRRLVNGFPESAGSGIPFSTVNLLPEQITVSQDGSVSTNIKLQAPIHLIPGEYCFILLANTQDYEVFVAEMGKTDLITSQVISKQPYVGVMFKSQNASTWTAVQEEDIKFRLNKAAFSSSGTALFEIKDHTQFDYSTIHLNSNSIVPAGTSLNWAIKTLDKATLIMDTDFSDISSGVDIGISAVRRATLRASNGGNASLVLQATLSTDNEDVSPAIDLEGLSTILINNNINYTDISGTDLEAVASGGDALARYISRTITLADGFDASNIVVTLDAYKPTGTDVRVYYKTLPTEKTTPIVNEPWVRMALKSAVGNSTSDDDFREHKFYPVNAFTNYGIPVDNPISPRFNVWAIKIVLVSQNQATTPMVRDLRAIALDS